MMPAQRRTTAGRATGEPGNTAEGAAIAAETTDPPLKTGLTAEPSPPGDSADPLAGTWSRDPRPRAADAYDVITTAHLKAWADFERERNRHSRLGGNIGGSAAIRLDRLDIVVSGIELLVAWMENGCPTADTVLSPEDREYWIETRKRHLPVPEYVAKQLPPE